MKKLLLLLLFAAPCALFSQVPFKPNDLVFHLFQNDTESFFGLANVTPSFWTFYGAFPEDGAIKVMNGTSLDGDALTLATGMGVNVNGGVVSITGAGISIGYSITVTSDGQYLTLDAKAVSGFLPFGHSVILGFDSYGINLTPAQAVNGLNNGSISQNIFNALFRGSSPDFQNQVLVLQAPPPTPPPAPTGGSTGDDGSGSGPNGDNGPPPDNNPPDGTVTAGDPVPVPDPIPPDNDGCG